MDDEERPGARNPGRRRLRRWAVAGGIALVLWLIASWAVAYRLTRRPRPRFDEPVPCLAWGKLDPIRLNTRDGHSLGAWIVPGRDDGPSVLLIHGNGGSRWNCLGRAEMLAARSCAVLIISTRAHGDSSGEFNDIGFGARLDVVAGVEFLERLRPGRPIVVHGTSMGAAAATLAAEELGGRVRGYILESPYRDLRTAVWNRVENALPPVLDAIAYRGLMAVAPMVLPHLDRIAPAEAIAGVPREVPILILAGDLDRNARPEEARALFDRVRSHATLYIFPGADHLRMKEADPDRYRAAVIGLIDAATVRADRSGVTSPAGG